MSRESYSQACRSNAPASSCPLCFKPMDFRKGGICDSCYADLYKSGNLMEKKEKV